MKKPVAFMFAGQGAQKVGMAGELGGIEKVAELFDTAESVCPGIIELMLRGSQEELNRTLHTQPAMFVADLAYAYKAEAEYGEPVAVCGFSVGEIPALVYAGMLSAADGMRVICERARLMDIAAGNKSGAMAAVVGLPPARVESIAAGVEDAWAVNYNAPEQTVIACSASSLSAVTEAVKAAGGRAIRLNVSGAFHCPYMADASAGLKTFLEAIPFRLPRIPVFANLTATPYPSEPAEMRRTLAEQVVSPVRFVDTVLHMKLYGAEEFVECGPGKVLTGLTAKILN